MSTDHKSVIHTHRTGCPLHEYASLELASHPLQCFSSKLLQFNYPVVLYMTRFNPLTPTVAIWVQLLKHPVPDRVKPSFVIFDIRALWRSGMSVRVSGCPKLQITHEPYINSGRQRVNPSSHKVAFHSNSFAIIIFALRISIFSLSVRKNFTFSYQTYKLGLLLILNWFI